MKMLSCKRFLYGVVCACSFASAANADTVYNNLPPFSVDGADPVAAGPLADSFSTGTSSFTMNEVALSLVSMGNTNGSITVSLLSDSAGSPGSLLTTIGTLGDPNNLVVTTYDFSSFTPVLLAANTRYWIELTSNIQDPNNLNGQYWTFSNDLSGPGVANEFNLSTTGTVQANAVNSPYQMGVFGMASNVIPEPTSVVLLGIGLVAIAGCGRFRNRRAA